MLKAKIKYSWLMRRVKQFQDIFCFRRNFFSLLISIFSVPSASLTISYWRNGKEHVRFYCMKTMN